MEKRQLIADILRINTSAQPAFLAQFDEAALAAYLRQLQAAKDRTVHISSWVKRRPNPLRKVS